MRALLRASPLLPHGFPLATAQVHRQADREFVAILHALRDGSATAEQLDELWRRCRCVPARLPLRGDPQCGCSCCACFGCH